MLGIWNRNGSVLVVNGPHPLRGTFFLYRPQGGGGYRAIENRKPRIKNGTNAERPTPVARF
jgi:hypothetical protein